MRDETRSSARYDLPEDHSDAQRTLCRCGATPTWRAAPWRV